MEGQNERALQESQEWSQLLKGYFSFITIFSPLKDKNQ
jgi:hypothetical protein